MSEPLYRKPTGYDAPGLIAWRAVVPVEPDDFQRVRQGGGMGSFRCNTCGTDCRADGPGCEGSDYDFTPSYWPDDEGDYMLVPCVEVGEDSTP